MESDKNCVARSSSLATPKLRYVAQCVTVLALVTTFDGCGRKTKPSVSVGIKSAAPTFSHGEPVRITWTLTNDSDETIWLLKWGTPLEGWLTILFEVRHNGLEIPYRGAQMSRDSPTKADFVKIEAWKSIACTLDLREAYDLSAPGEYVIWYDGLETIIVGDSIDLARSERHLQSVTSNSLTITVTPEEE